MRCWCLLFAKIDCDIEEVNAKNYIPLSSNDLIFLNFVPFFWLNTLKSNNIQQKSVFWLKFTKKTKVKEMRNVAHRFFFRSSHQLTKWLNSIRSMNFGQFVVRVHHRSENTSRSIVLSMFNDRLNQVFRLMDSF